MFVSGKPPIREGLTLNGLGRIYGLHVCSLYRLRGDATPQRLMACFVSAACEDSDLDFNPLGAEVRARNSYQ